MTPADNRLIVVGAGPMGLAAAYYAARAGWKVEVLEAGDRPGGMAAHFDFNGLSLERFYHFCARTDRDTEALLAELGLPPIRWAPTRMGYYVDGALHPWGDPISLLRFPGLSLVEKVRYGLQAFLSSKRSDWRKLDRISAADWFRAWCGRRVYDKLWRPLLELKFYAYAEQISAAWIWQRIKRVAQSRRSLFQEEMGYIEGGSETLVEALTQAIEAMGGRIHLSTPASRILMDGDVVAGVQARDGQLFEAGQVISTIAMPYVAELLAERPELARTYGEFQNVGCVCVIHQLAKPVSENFWVNISDPAIDIPGFVEFSNLRPLDRHIVYVPYYMPGNRPEFGRPDEVFVSESFAHLQRVNPALRQEDRLASHVARLRYAQPVCDVGFASRIPPVRTPIAGLQIADTSFYYPEDRGVSESIGFARRMAEDLPRA
jgi:protoporphyrinogen oxidase